MMMEWLEKVENFFLNILKKIKLGFLAKIYEEHREGMRYLVFGALATVVNIAVYAICMYAFNIENGISNIIAWVVAAIFAYFTNKFFVFDSKVNTKQELIQEVTSFFSCRILTLIIDEIIMIVTVDKWHFNGVLMKVVANIIVIILNYIFSKIIIFKKGAKENE